MGGGAVDDFTAQLGLRVEYSWEGLLSFKSKVRRNWHRAMTEQCRYGKGELMPYDKPRDSKLKAMFNRKKAQR